MSYSDDKSFNVGSRSQFVENEWLDISPIGHTSSTVRGRHPCTHTAAGNRATSEFGSGNNIRHGC